MHNKKNITIVVFILLIGVGVWYFYPSSEPFVVQKVESSVEQAMQSEPSIAEKLNRLEKQASPEDKKIATKLLEKIVQSSKKLSTISKIQKAQNMPIEFYGKVIDQHGEPVYGVKVHYTIAAYEGVISSGPAVRNYWVDTDSNGVFAVTGKTGERIAIRDREKYGYEFEKTFPYYEMSKQWVGHKLKSRGSPDKPVIFHAWKKTEAEALVHDILEVGYRPDGKFYRVSLKGVEEQLKISFTVDPNGNRSKPLDWSMKLKVIDGGIIESTDTFTNEAPLEGYLPILSYQYKKGDKGFSNDIRKKFYIKARNGQVYGRLECRIHPYYGRDNIVAFDVKYWLNPNGSRNLQYDSAKRIYPK